MPLDFVFFSLLTHAYVCKFAGEPKYHLFFIFSVLLQLALAFLFSGFPPKDHIEKCFVVYHFSRGNTTKNDDIFANIKVLLLKCLL